MEKNSKIYVAGHRGMVGSAIVRELQRQGYNNLVLRTHKELDLTRQDQVEKFFAEEKPEYVFLAAAKVGGIVANQNALADFMYDNMILEMNVIHAAWKKLLGIHIEETRIERDTCMPMFIAELFTKAKTWKQPRCPLAEEWISKCGTYTQWNITQP